MCVLRANWHQGVALNGDSATATVVDPFDTTDSVPMMADVKAPISLDTPQAELRSRLESLLRWEGRLDAKGITCPIKDLPDGSCLACPISQADNESSPKCALCRVGRQQGLAVMILHAQRAAQADGV